MSEQGRIVQYPEHIEALLREKDAEIERLKEDLHWSHPQGVGDELAALKAAALAFIEKFDRIEPARAEMMALKILVDPERWKP